MVSLTIDSYLLDVYSREKGPYPVTNFPQNMTHTLHAWKADHLRFSLFSNDVIQEPVEAIYSRIFGEQASEVSKKPASGENSAIGVHEDYDICLDNQKESERSQKSALFFIDT